MNNIINIRSIIMYFLLVNIITFLLMYIDKKKAKWGMWRIKENTLFVFAFLGGSIGGIIGMYLFRHKTKKIKFIIGFPSILIVEIICIIIFLSIMKR